MLIQKIYGGMLISVSKMCSLCLQRFYIRPFCVRFVIVGPLKNLKFEEAVSFSVQDRGEYPFESSAKLVATLFPRTKALKDLEG